MSRYYIHHDRERCIGCQACEVHCKSAHALPPGPRLNAIIAVESDEAESPRLTFIYMHCHHCTEPLCVNACPTGAMHRRPDDGIVTVREHLCIGCQSCIGACPWGAPQWDATRGKVVKCDFCVDRIDHGLQPACVTKCTTRALRWLTAGEAASLIRDRAARTLARP